MDPLLAYVSMDRRQAMASGAILPERAAGAVLFADIAGFTPLTASLVAELGARRGAEELTRHLNAVYELLVAAVHRYRGSVVAFSGDAITCFFGDDPDARVPATARAVRAGLAMQHVPASVEKLGLLRPGLALSVKVAIEAGRVRRFVVGRPDVQLLDVLAGATVDRVVAAVHVASQNEVVVGASLVEALGARLRVDALRPARDGQPVGVVSALDGPEEPCPWKDLAETVPFEAQLRPWLLPPVYNRLRLGQHSFLAELRPAIAFFLQFGGIDYEGDPAAGTKLDGFVRWVQAVVGRVEGWVIGVDTGDKGNCLYAAFGAPTAHEDDGGRAVTAALDLCVPPGELRFIKDVRIGLSQGRMWAGPYGSATRRTYGVLGDETNLAARLMETASPGTVLVSEAVVTLARSARFESRGSVTLKGRDTPVAVFEAMPVGRADIVDRESERTLLRNRLDAFTANRTGGVLSLEGEPGIGKSTVLRDLVAAAAAADVRVLRAATSAVERSTPFYAWRSVVAELLDSVPAGGLQRVRERLLAELRDVPEIGRLAPLLNAFLPLDLPENEFTALLQGDARAEYTHEVVVWLMARVTRERLVMLALEDAHWLDSASWTLTRRLHRALPDVLIVLAMRPLQPAPLDYERLMQASDALRLRLDPLPPADTLQLAARRLGGASLTEAVAAVIREKAQGNPFFAEELARALRDRGVIEIQDGQCRVKPGVDVAKLALPDTVEGVVMSRIDELTASQQLTLKVASVIGSTFSVQTLAAVHPMGSDRTHLDDDLEHLCELDLVDLDSLSPDPSCRFRHVITQEVAYDLLLFEQRRTLHHAVAETYEAAHRDDLQYYSLLAHHWTMAQVPGKALQYLEKAGDLALLNDANAEAVRFFSGAIAILEDASRGGAGATEPVDVVRRARWDVALGQACYRMGRLGESGRHFREALGRLGHSLPHSPERIVLAVLTEAARQLVRHLMPAFLDRPSADREQMPLVYASYQALGELAFLHGDSSLAVYGLLRSLNVVRSAGPSPELAVSYAHACVACGLVPAHTLAGIFRRRALDVARQLDNPPARAEILTAIGVYEAGSGELTAAEARFDEGAALFESAGNLHRWASTLQARGAVARARGDLYSFADVTDRIAAAGARRDDVLDRAWALNDRAEYLLLGPGDAAAALACARDALPLIEQAGERAAEIICRSLIALALLRLERFDEAAGAADATLALMQRAGRPTSFGMLGAYDAVADVCVSLWEQRASVEPGDRSRGLAACRVMDRFAAVFPIGRPRAALHRGRYYWQKGRHAKAHHFWNRARAVAERLGMRCDEGLALYEAARRRSATDPRSRADLRRAAALFEQAGATYHAHLAQAVLNHVSLERGADSVAGTAPTANAGS